MKPLSIKEIQNFQMPFWRIIQFQLVLFGMLTMGSCGNQGGNSSQKPRQNELSDLVQLMTGTFSSEQQSKEDTSFFNINLVMYPIWESDENVKWLYVEQAVTKFIDKPYRQRVYRLSMQQDSVFESRIFELPDPSRFIHGWDQPNIFEKITPDSLILRQGCAVFMKKEADCFTGSTDGKACKSTLRGAAYATSIVSICKDQVVSWDQGWDIDDQQVWGAEKRGYIFRKLKGS